MKNMAKRRMSKTRYLEGIRCDRWFHISMKDPDRIPPPDETSLFTMNQGTETGVLAREEYPGGVLIPALPLSKSLEDTEKAMAGGAQHIYEAAFEHNGIHVKVDILKKVDEGTYDIVEVKASSMLKKEYIPDMAIQKYVMEQKGLQVRSCRLMHLNSEHRHPDQGPLFVEEECTPLVDQEIRDVAENLAHMQSVLGLEEPPLVLIGRQCLGPSYECPLKQECWREVPTLSVFNIPGLGNEKRFELYHKGVTLENITDDQLPSGPKTRVKAREYIDSVRNNTPNIDIEGIGRYISEIGQPLYFLDFETIGWAIPRFPGTKPHHTIPFQWSIHRLEDGVLEHSEYLHQGNGDPRPELLATLLEALGTEGSIVVFTSYERGVLKGLIEYQPEKTKELQAIIDRLWDLNKIFVDHYTHPYAQGRTSIKTVLPALCPHLSYTELGIQQGMAASAGYAKLATADPEEKDRIMRELLEYCKLDTLAMVEIYNRILGDIGSQDTHNHIS